LKILIANGAEIDEPNQEGITPLATCFMRGHCLEIAEFLLHSGAKMSNVASYITVPAWMNLVIEKRHSVMSTTLTLKGVLKWRLGIYKDVTNLLGLYVWNKRVSNEFVSE
jgi:ankyrin repeat protein